MTPRRVSPRVTRALALYDRLRRVQREPEGAARTLKALALTRRIVSFLDTCRPVETDAYYAGVEARRRA